MTTLGLLSDTHGRAETARDAVDLLLEHGADMLIHLGDVGSAEVIDTLAATHPSTGQQIESHLVFGNCDWEAQSLSRYAQDLGVIVHDPAGDIVVDNKRLIFTHGHFGHVLQHAVETGSDYLLHGHTHEKRDETIGQTRVINPGALHRAKRHTVALLTPGTGQLQVLEVASVVR
ncbi:MAG: metallophosphoesterase family protein [Phycisphaeraceae bacterium]